MNFLKKCVCVVMTLAMASSVALTSYAATPAANTTSTSASTTAKKTVAPTKVTLNKTSATLVKGKTLTLKATLTPSNASTKFTWSSSDKSVATVDSNGKVKAVKKGTATITVKTSNNKKATCKITVITQNEALENEVIKLVNAERTKRGLSKLTTNSKMASASDKRAKEIYTKFSHTRPNGKAWDTVFAEYGIKKGYAGENIAYNYSSAAKDVVNMWMNSKGHRENILNSRYKTIGVGLYVKDGRYNWGQLFNS